MTKHSIEIRGKEVPVVGQQVGPCMRSKAFKDWVKLLNKSGFMLDRIRLIGSFCYGPMHDRKALFNFGCGETEVDGKYEKFVRNANGDEVPSAFLQRGNSVFALNEIVCKKKSYVITVTQSRFAIGDEEFRSLVAGMMDESGNPKLVGAKEIQEEAGINIDESLLIDMTKIMYGEDCSGICASEGLFDERYFCLYSRTKIDEETFGRIQGSVAGAKGEKEKTTVELIPFDNTLVEECQSAGVHSAYLLYIILSEDGRLQAAVKAAKKAASKTPKMKKSTKLKSAKKR